MDDLRSVVSRDQYLPWDLRYLALGGRASPDAVLVASRCETESRRELRRVE